MVLGGLALLIVIFSGYLWLSRGFFNGLIHLACVLVAGAVAFAVWEPVAYLLLTSMPSTSFVNALAWALALALPFGLTLVLLRLATNAIIKANVQVGELADNIGGGVCGLISGVIVTGVMVVSLGLLRTDTEMMGQRATNFDNGSVTRKSSIFFPVDRITLWLYGTASEAALASGEPLAKWHPDLVYTPTAMRSAFGDGKARNAAAPTDFNVTSRFTVGKPAVAGQSAPPLASLLSDSWDSNPQTVRDFDGNSYPAGTYIEGFVVNFKASAKEGDGKIIVGGQQVWLIAESSTGQRKTIFPVAVSSQAESAKPYFSRWRFTQEGDFIGSVGGLAEANFAFEFPMPPDFQPIGLYVKGCRHIVNDGATAKPSKAFATASERDSYIISLGAPQDPSQFTGQETLPPNMQRGPDGELLYTVKVSKEGETEFPDGFIYRNSLLFTVQKGTHGGLEIDENNNIVGGSNRFAPDAFKDTVGIDRRLQINKFGVTSDTVVVQIDVSARSRTSILGKTLDLAEALLPPILRDTQGGVYQPIGYIYTSSQYTEISYKPSEPITSMSLLPKLSTSQPDQKLTLIFRVSLGVDIQSFGLGDKKIIARYDPPLRLNKKQN